MGRRILKRAAVLFVFAVLAIALPWIGSLAMTPIRRTPAFRWPIFLLYAVIIAVCTAPLIWRLVRSAPGSAATPARRPFPWWGWIGVGLAAAFWVLAWTRFEWFAPLQRYTFTPLWLGYILAINALAFRNGGHCLLRDRPGCFLLLFPASAAFWWYFEYINGYVQNWHYVGVESIGPLAYAVHATISFSTVLPAVVGTREWLASFPRLQRGLGQMWTVRGADSRALAGVLLVAGALGLLGTGMWPAQMYGMVWIAPMLILAALGALAGLSNPLTPLARGDWRGLGLAALAALFCGLFWELWNWHSLAHWEYSIPFVQRFQIFEMPLLGYAGYLPFGVACICVAELACGRTMDVSSSNRD